MKGVQSPRENAQFLMANTALKEFAGFFVLGTRCKILLRRRVQPRISSCTHNSLLYHGSRYWINPISLLPKEEKVKFMNSHLTTDLVAFPLSVAFLCGLDLLSPHSLIPRKTFSSTISSSQRYSAASSRFSLAVKNPRVTILIVSVAFGTLGTKVDQK